MNTKQAMITLTLIILMSNSAAALIEPDWPMDKPNEKLHQSDLFIDFEGGTQNEYPILDMPGVNFVDHLGFPWVYAEKGCQRMNIFPDIWNPGHEYVVNGGFGAFVCWAKIPHYAGVLVFPDGATHVSVLASNGCHLKMTAYDKIGKVLELCVAEPNAGTLTFTRMTVSSSKPLIHKVVFEGIGNFWLIDDLVVGGLTFPDEPIDYSDVSRLAEELYGVRYLEHGLGHDYVVFGYLDPWQFHYPYVHEYWNPETKTFMLDEGISDEGLVLWAYNKITRELYGEGVVKWSTTEGMMKHDFTVSVETTDTIPGDVYFMDHNFDEKPDWIGMVVETTDTGMNLIGSYDGISEGENIGVIYSKKSIVEGSPAFMGYYRLPGVIKGGHNPIPKGH